jgi:hypothetical protein
MFQVVFRNPFYQAPLRDIRCYENLRIDIGPDVLITILDYSISLASGRAHVKKGVFHDIISLKTA